MCYGLVALSVLVEDAAFQGRSVNDPLTNRALKDVMRLKREMFDLAQDLHQKAQPGEHYLWSAVQGLQAAQEGLHKAFGALIFVTGRKSLWKGTNQYDD